MIIWRNGEYNLHTNGEYTAQEIINAINTWNDEYSFVEVILYSDDHTYGYQAEDGDEVITADDTRKFQVEDINEEDYVYYVSVSPIE